MESSEYLYAQVDFVSSVVIYFSVLDVIVPDCYRKVKFSVI